MYLGLLDAFLPSLLDGTAWRTAQNEAKATYTAKLLPEDFRIDWTWPTQRAYNLIRAAAVPWSLHEPWGSQAEDLVGSPDHLGATLRWKGSGASY